MECDLAEATVCDRAKFRPAPLMIPGLGARLRRSIEGVAIARPRNAADPPRRFDLAPNRNPEAESAERHKHRAGESANPLGNDAT
jgi:hypothetical protein